MRKLEKNQLLADAKGKKGCGIFLLAFLLIPMLILFVIMFTGTENSPEMIFIVLSSFALVVGFLVFMYKRNYASIEMLIKKNQYFVVKQSVTDKRTVGENDDCALYLGTKHGTIVNKDLYHRVEIGHQFFAVYTSNHKKVPVLIYDADVYEPGETIIYIEDTDVFKQ